MTSSSRVPTEGASREGALSPRTSSSRHRLYAAGGIALTGIVLVLGVVGWLNRPPTTTSHASARPAQRPGEADAIPTELELTEEKIVRAKLQVGVAERRRFQETRAVPGVIAYDGAKHLNITAPVAGLVKRVLAEPGQMIQASEPLVILSSPEVGLARDEVARRIADLELASQEYEWATSISDNVEALVKWFGKRPSIEEIEQKFAEQSLGDYREKLISAYSKLAFAEQVFASTNAPDQQGTLARRIVDERRSNREVAAATFQSACETSRYDSLQARRRTLAAESQAKRLLSVARERLATLLGPQVDAEDVQVGGANAADLPTASPDESPQNESPKKDLSEYTLLAPFTGRIEERLTVDAARVAQGDSLFVMADTTTLWVEAEIHERNWRALSQVSASPIPIRVPALDDANFETKLRFVGPSVSAVSRSVPLVSELTNADGLFKPGMFVWVDVPLDRERQAIVVPVGAVMRHEGMAFVFAPRGDRKFDRVDVTTGLESGAFVEILQGLAPGQKLVTHGAFYLKSELLLEREVK